MTFGKKALLFLLGLTAALASLAQSTTHLDLAVRRVRLNSAMRHATLSVCVYNIAKDTSIYVFNADRSMTPASLNKLFTTATGFGKLGNDFRFKTILSHDGHIDNRGTLHGNLYIIGGGDPLLGSSRYKQTQPDSLFRTWAKSLREDGIRSIEGRIYADASIFDDDPAQESWQWGDIGNYYGCGALGLNFHENMYTAYFRGAQRKGDPATITGTKPANLQLQGYNRVISVDADSVDDVYIFGDPMLNVRHYRGTVAVGAKDVAVRGALPRPAECCAEQFTAYLRNHGCPVSGNASQEFEQPKKLSPLMDYQSMPYGTIAQYANLTSNNMYAECIFKYLGYWYDGKGSYATGQNAIYRYFDELNLPSEGTRIVDGSGLSRLNRTTTNFLCKFLCKVAQQPYYTQFRQTLGIPGQTGTVRSMHVALDDGASLYIKSGSMNGVKGYAGYYINHKGVPFSFVVLSNHHDCDNATITQLLKSIIDQVAKL